MWLTASMPAVLHRYAIVGSSAAGRLSLSVVEPKFLGFLWPTHRVNAAKLKGLCF